VLEVHVAAEQTPDRDNQLQLTGEQDRVGRRRVRLKLGWSQSDRDNLLRSASLFASEIEGSGLGAFHRWVEYTGATRPMSYGVHHPMGGTRMHADPRLGVVDENCKVHGVANLYLAGSSVFTTGLGYANPTLTLLALSVRLADHVAAAQGRPSAVDAQV
jgi:choline dehydrogenase-like flavoprotein